MPTLRRSAFVRAVLAGAAGAALGLRPRTTLARDWHVLRVATEGGFPPFNMAAPDGTLIGFEPDLVAELCVRMKVKCDLQQQNWDGMIAGLNGDKYDAVIDGMSITAQREAVIAFSVPYTGSGATFAVMTDGPFASLPGTGTRVSLADEAATGQAIAGLAKALAGKTIAVQVATTQFAFLTRYLKNDVTIRSYATGPDSYLDLKSGRADALMASSTNIAAFVKRSRGEIMPAGYSFFGGVLGVGSAIGLRKSDPDLKAMLDKALQSMVEDGALTRLSIKWFGTDVTPKA